jgi:hypothetical protein
MLTSLLRSLPRRYHRSNLRDELSTHRGGGPTRARHHFSLQSNLLRYKKGCYGCAIARGNPVVAHDWTAKMDLFVLGAGFSRSFVGTAPVLARFLAGRGETLLNKFIHAKRFLDQCRFEASTANIETVLTLADEHDRVAAEEFKTLIVEVLHESFPSHEWMEGKNTVYQFDVNDEKTLSSFAKHLLNRSPLAQVITFNYDTVLENSLELQQMRQNRPLRFHSGRCYGFHASTWRKDGSGIRWQQETEHKYHLLVLKPHGSVNWRVPNDLQYQHRVVITSSHERNLNTRYKKAEEFIQSGTNSMPLIVPPVLDKSDQIGNLALAQVWARAATLIQEAQRIVFVGYSFPPTDYHAEYLFRVNYSTACQVDVIDLGEPTDNRKLLKDRYEDIFRQAKVTFYWGDAAAELKKLEGL